MALIWRAPGSIFLLDENRRVQAELLVSSAGLRVAGSSGATAKHGQRLRCSRQRKRSRGEKEKGGGARRGRGARVC
jgi:hypothetical protein